MSVPHDETGTSVLTDPWTGLREQSAAPDDIAGAGMTLDDDYRARLLPLVDAVEEGAPPARYHPARHSLVARLPEVWTVPRVEQLVRLVDELGLQGVVSVAALRRWPDLAHLTLAMLPAEPPPGATVDLPSLPVAFDGLFVGTRRTVGRGYGVARLAPEDAVVLAGLRRDLASHPPRPLMSGVLHLRRDVPPGAEAAALARLLAAADHLLRGEVVLTDLVWNATHDDMVLTARQRTAGPPGHGR